MNAYVYEGEGKLQLSGVKEPRTSPHSAVMRIITSSICGSDVRTFREGNGALAVGRIIGHEACGEIVEIGSRVSDFQVGNRVVVAPAIGCGQCPSCERGRPNMCDDLHTLGYEYDGTFAEYTEIPAQAFLMGNVMKVDDGLPSREVCLAEPVACCINGQRPLRIADGDTVVIFGAGFIGSSHAELALRKGAARVIMIDISKLRLETVGALIPEVELVDSNEADVKNLVMDRTAGRGAEVVITANPDGKTHATAMSIACKGGRVSLFGGLPGNGTGYLDSNAIHYNELSVFGSHATTPAYVRQVLDWIARGDLDLGKYCSGVYRLEQIDEAFERLRAADALKLFVEP